MGHLLRLACRTFGHKPAHPLADHLDRRFARSGTLGDSRPCAITTSRSLISNSSSSSSLTTSSAQPASRSASSSPRICAAAPTSTPQVGCETISSFGLASISRPTMNFCRLPPDRLLAAAPGPPALTLKRLIRSSASWLHLHHPQPAALRDVLGARQQRVVGQRERRHRAAAEPLLGHEVQPQLAPVPRRVVRHVAAEQADRVRRRARILARQRGHELLLAVARDAGHADDLAGTHVEGDVGERGAELVLLRQAQALDLEHHARRAWARGAAAAAARRRSSAATGWRWSPASGRPRR